MRILNLALFCALWGSAFTRFYAKHSSGPDRTHTVDYALVTLAGFSWLFALPANIRGHAQNPYIGLLIFVVVMRPIAMGSRRLGECRPFEWFGSEI